MILFLGLDTLTDNAWTLWHKSGLPNALDFLHNVRFTEPMDIAILLGDQFADRANYTNFTYGGYDFGQGIFYIGTNSEVFVPMTAATALAIPRHRHRGHRDAGRSRPAPHHALGGRAAVEFAQRLRARVGLESVRVRRDRIVQRADQRPLSVARLSRRARVGAAG